MIPISKQLDALPSDGDTEAIMQRDTATSSKKPRIPPVTIFNKQREEIVELIRRLDISSYSLKNLHNALHVYCDSPVDFKELKDKLKEEQVNCYSHDLKEDKHFKVVLKGLHKQTVTELQRKLLTKKIEPIRIITPKNPRFTHDVVFVFSFKTGMSHHCSVGNVQTQRRPHTMYSLSKTRTWFAQLQYAG